MQRWNNSRWDNGTGSFPSISLGNRIFISKISQIQLPFGFYFNHYSVPVVHNCPFNVKDITHLTVKILQNQQSLIWIQENLEYRIFHCGWQVLHAACHKQHNVMYRWAGSLVFFPFWKVFWKCTFYTHASYIISGNCSASQSHTPSPFAMGLFVTVSQIHKIMKMRFIFTQVLSPG